MPEKEFALPAWIFITVLLTWRRRPGAGPELLEALPGFLTYGKMIWLEMATMERAR